MNRQFSRYGVALLGLVLACGTRDKPGQPQGGSGSQIGSSAAPGEPWNILAMTGERVIVASGHRATVLDRAGHVLAHLKVSDVEPLKDAIFTKDAVIWADGGGLDELHLVDLVTGAERWHVTLEQRAHLTLAGDQQVAIGHSNGVDLYRLSDGVHGYHRHGPAVTVGGFRDGTFVFGDEQGHVEAVDEATNQQRWSFAFHVAAPTTIEPELSFHDAAVLAFYGGHLKFGGGEFAEIDRASGKVISQGQCVDRPPGEFPHDVAHISGGGALIATGKKIDARTVFRMDVVGRILWRSNEWRTDVAGAVESLQPAQHSGPSAAVILKPSQAPRVLLGFDDNTGHVGFRRTLGEHTSLVGVSGDCTLVLDLDHERKLECLNPATGAVQWARAVIGENVTAWRVGEHILLAEAAPVTLSYLDEHGKVVWQSDLRDTELSTVGLAARTKGGVLEPWALGSELLVLPDMPKVSIVDLTTGKRAEVSP